MNMQMLLVGVLGICVCMHGIVGQQTEEMVARGHVEKSQHFQAVNDAGPELFVVPKKPQSARRKKSSSRLKQELAESMIELIKIESKKIEQAAQVQQALYQRVEELLDSKKDCFFGQATRDQLEQSLAVISNCIRQEGLSLARQAEIQSFVRQGCAVVEKKTEK